MNMHTASQQSKRREVRGFSLIELMVSLTIFSIVMTVSVGTLLVVIDANAKSQSLYGAMTDLSFALDNVTRNVRMGRDYYCSNSMSSPLPSNTNDCATGGTAIAFTRNADNVRVGYRINNQRIEQKEGTGSWVAITSASTGAGLAVDIQKFEIIVDDTTAAGDGDFKQPTMSLLIAGEVSNGLDVPTTFRLQSNVTPRILNY